MQSCRCEYENVKVSVTWVRKLAPISSWKTYRKPRKNTQKWQKSAKLMGFDGRCRVLITRPSTSTTKIKSPHRAFYFCMCYDLWWELRVGAVLREQNALPTPLSITIYLTAKDAINNGGAGRAAKSATLTTSTTRIDA